MDCIGDYEQQISLIDAYNTLCSDRINDKEQFIDAVLVVYGALLGDDDEEETKALQDMHKNGVMRTTSSDARSEYLLEHLTRMLWKHSRALDKRRYPFTFSCS